MSTSAISSASTIANASAPTSTEPVEQKTGTTTTAAPAKNDAVRDEKVATAQSDPLAKAKNDALDLQKQASQMAMRYLEKAEANLEKLRKEREEAMATIKIPKPQLESPMTPDQWKQWQGQLDAALQPWTKGAADNGGINVREGQTLASVRNALTNNAKFLTYDKAMDMLKTVTPRLSSDTKKFEDKGGISVLNAISSYADGESRAHQQKVAQWQANRDAANAVLGNLTPLMNNSVKDVENTIRLVGQIAQNGTAAIGKVATTLSASLARMEQAEDKAYEKADREAEEAKRRAEEQSNLIIKLKSNNQMTNSVKVKVSVNDAPSTNANVNVPSGVPNNVSANFKIG